MRHAGTQKIGRRAVASAMIAACSTHIRLPVKIGILPTHRIRQFGAPFASLFGDDADDVDPVANPMGDYRVTGLMEGNRLFFHATLFINCPLSSLCPFFCPSFL